MIKELLGTGDAERTGDVRRLTARWVIQGDLELETATHFGGSGRSFTDMPLLRDALEDDKPLLTGASLAGALRSHLADCAAGYSQDESSAVAELFGGAPRTATPRKKPLQDEDQGSQSSLVIFDSVGVLAGGAIESRDGVSIDATSGTAKEGKKFDLEVLPAGTRFEIRMDLLVSSTEEEPGQVGALATALRALEEGEINLGARGTRGLGKCRVSSWRVGRFALDSAGAWKTWLATDPENPLAAAEPQQRLTDAIVAALPGETAMASLADQRDRFSAKLTLSWPQAGLLVRSAGSEPEDPDSVHLRSGGEAVLPGTSVAGALRARATRICRLFSADAEGAEAVVAGVFGPRMGDRTPGEEENEAAASRLRVSENTVPAGEEVHRLQPSRIRVDRFTGGVVHGALFTEEPLYGGRTELKLELRSPQPGEMGLILLLIKDLLTGDLPLGGTSSVGRGVAAGSASLTLEGQAIEWAPNGPALKAEEARLLNSEVKALRELCRPAAAEASG